MSFRTKTGVDAAWKISCADYDEHLTQLNAHPWPN